MGKRKIGEINRKPIVIGDPNLISKNEVNVDSLSSGEGGGSTWRYFDATNRNEYTASIMFFFYLYKHDNGLIHNWSSLPREDGMPDFSSVVGCAVDGESKLVLDGQMFTWNEVMALEGLTPEIMPQFGIAEITEEEFYAI